jgi:hypothetical protein
VALAAEPVDPESGIRTIKGARRATLTVAPHADREPFALAVLGGRRVTEDGLGPVAVPIRARLGPEQAEQLAAEGQALVVMGIVEARVGEDGLPIVPTAPAPKAKPWKAIREERQKAEEERGALLPQSEEAYVDLIEARLKKAGGRMLMRQLGSVVPRPRKHPARSLKRLLMKKENRRRFVIDLQGYVTLNYSGRGRWVAIIDKARRDPNPAMEDRIV